MYHFSYENLYVMQYVQMGRAESNSSEHGRPWPVKYVQVRHMFTLVTAGACNILSRM